MLIKIIKIVIIIILLASLWFSGYNSGINDTIKFLNSSHEQKQEGLNTL